MQKVYVINLDNGLSYEDNEVKSVAVCLNKSDAKRFVKDNSPVTIEMYKDTFHTSIPEWVFDVRLHIEEVRLIEYE